MELIMTTMGARSAGVRQEKGRLMTGLGGTKNLDFGALRRALVKISM